MAAMAPALTDAPAEAHHIRFKLAAQSSSLSPGSTEDGNTSNILIHNSSGTGKCKVSAADENSHNFCSGNQEQPTQQHQQSSASTLGKLQPLVASYLCSDVTPVPSTKESIKLQGVLIKQSVLKSHGILPSSLFNGGGDFLLSKRQTLELSGGQLKSLMSSNGGGQAVAAINGLAKKLAMSGAAGSVVALNRSKPSASAESQPLTPPPDSKAFMGAILKGPVKQKHSLVVSHSAGGNGLQQQPAHFVAPDTPSNQPDTPSNQLMSPVTDWERAGRSQQGSPVCSPAPQSPSSTLCSLDAQVKERTLLNRSRQGEIEGRMRRLRKRLQVVQAKQVERHVKQQLGGFLDSSLSMLPPATTTRKGDTTATWRPGRHSLGARDSLGRFLKSGSIPTELERLYLSGTANLHVAESNFDSDVTESSSGGDTDLEEEVLTRVDIEQRHIKIWKRAESRYTIERASIISHWNWLQAHISDLEYRIRQQTDVYRQIRANKGSVELGGVAPSALVVGGAGVKTEPTPQDCQVTITESGPWRGQNGRPVNGVLNRVSESNTKHQPSPNDSTCVAARTRPLLNCRRRRLVQPNTVPNLNGKVPRTSAILCSCRVNPSSCVTCGGRPSAPREDPQYELPSLERLSHLDPGVHPILSLPDDVCMSLRLQQVMKSHWQGKAPERTKPLKKLSLKHKLSSKDKHIKLANSLMAHRLSHYKSRAEKQQRRQHHHLDGNGGVLSAARLEGQALCKAERLLHGLPSPSTGPYDRSYSRKRPREHLLDRTHGSTPKLFLDSGSPCSSLASLHSSLHSPSLTRQLSTSSESSTHIGPNSLSFSNTPQPIRRRRGESSFDINNIVIPMSVAATTRVEKLQYKEIVTPNWREVDIFSQPMAEEENHTEMEDLSDAAFSQLHQPCQDQERSRWTWMALAPAKRRGSRSYKSMDGRTTPLLCSTNPPTPQPASPDPGHCPLLHDYSHVASPISPDATSNPHTPCSRDSHRLLSSEDTRCSTPDFTFEERTVAPWEHRNFPLPEDPSPEPEVEGEDEMRRSRMRSVSCCPSTGYDTDSPLPCDDDAPKQKGHAHQ
ncbi:KAT8 regulatory NSL complex subunit 1 [Salvelinus namaycush]|uniref:KAT8 regulatory NSL complex subunit 1 n=1 Tax=Salvelinus namaycush TaxID=8040 RepID=A0A8U0QN64_SALNM|nr:KAT8 regulatory NSL complex subunit 1 [Salvelinus namaycush]XP_038847467.1 KAT8 regulatory NSL complex subunit 1 [Salvelinus namaycush]XP_038847468.1 KAT8 regulatory NSL complex subunit 1 [Salvelinus namaycush]